MASLVRNGEELHLKPKAFRLLLHLIQERDRLVTKEELMELFWKDTAVTDDALTQCVAEVRRALGDTPRNSLYLKTVPRMGYRFVGPVEEVRVPIEEVRLEANHNQSSQPLPAAALPVRRHNQLGWVLTVSLLAASVAGGYLWTAGPGRPPSNVAKRQIAILRFENSSGAAEIDWLRDGLPDMLATTLSKSRALDVLTRTQVYGRRNRTDPGSPEAAIELARSVHAQAAAIGRFSKLGESIRVDVWVYDVRNGSLLASENLTVEKQDQLLAQVDFLATRISSHLAPQSKDTDRRMLSTLLTSNLEAYRYYSLGLEKAEALQTKQAVGLFEKALELDPRFVMALARIGYAHAVTDSQLVKGRPYLEKAYQMSSGLTDKDRQHIVAWYAIANQDYQTAIRRYSELISEYPVDSEAYFRLAMLMRGESRHEEAVALLRQAIAIDAEDPKLYNAMGAVSSEMGRHEIAISMVKRYIALSPGDANALDSLGLALQLAGNNRDALEAYNKALEMNPEFEIARFHRATLYAQMGRFREGIRESLSLADTASSNHNRRRGLSQAAWQEWRRGNLAAAKVHAAKAETYSAEDLHDWNPASILLKPTNRWTPSQWTSAVGRGGRFGQRSGYYFFALQAKAKGNLEEMFNNLRQLLKVKTSWGEPDTFEDALAEAYWDLGRMDEAISEYERALHVFPGMARARNHLALAYLKQGNPSAAQVQFKEFLQLWKDADSDVPELASAHRLMTSP